MDLPYYHGPLTKRDCETLLLKDGVDGNFLLRDSESAPGVLCLCVSFKNVVYTYRIFKERHGYYRIQGDSGFLKDAPEKLAKEGGLLYLQTELGIPWLFIFFTQAAQTVEGAQKQIFPNLEELISKFEKPNQENSNSDYVDVLP